MYVLPDYTIVEQTYDYIIMEKRFGDNGAGHIRHQFPLRSDPEEKKRAYNKVFGILYDAAMRKEAEKGRTEDV